MGSELDKHLKAHTDLQQAVHELVEAIELIEGLVVNDEGTRTALARKLARSKMLLHEARQDMRASRLGDARLSPVARLRP
jgi:hypothetical protein